jgi:putative DNA primase/helicase
LIAPLQDIDGALRSLQYIAVDGTKLFLKGGRKKGCYFTIGEPKDAFVICEGYATGASIHEATGSPVIIAFDAGNLLPVARALRTKHPFAAITIAADDDVATDGNPGLTKAREAAAAIGASLAVPDFGGNRPKNATDFNDLHKYAGAAAVAEQIKRAKLPEAPDAEAEIERLSKLPFIEFERARKEEAKRLGIRATVLDKMVNDKRPKEKKNSFGVFDPDPWPDPVDGADLLDDVSKLVARFLICADDERVAITLWTVLTWFEEAAQVAPILNITSPTPECGKSTLVSIVMRLVKRPISASNISGPGIFHVIDEQHPTLGIDEADSFMRDDDSIRGVINSGHTREQAFVIRCVGDPPRAERYTTWGFKAISGIGSRAATIEGRSITVKLRRKLSTEKRERLRYSSGVAFDEVVHMLARFAADNMEGFRHIRPQLPEVLSDRAQDNWEGLFIVAELAGGHWPRTVHAAALAHVGVSDESEAGLLEDVYNIFVAQDPVPEAMSSADLITALVAMPDRDWHQCNRGKPITQNGMARRLKDFKIYPGLCHTGRGRVERKTFKGYTFSAIENAYAPYRRESTVPTVPPTEDQTEPSAYGGTVADSEGDEESPTVPPQPTDSKDNTDGGTVGTVGNGESGYEGFSNFKSEAPPPIKIAGDDWLEKRRANRKAGKPSAPWEGEI